MADYLFTLVDSPTLTNFSFSIPSRSPQNPSIALPAVSFGNLRTARGRKKKPLHLSLLSNNNQEPTPSSSNLDVISCHEHSDGSLIFRFGNPSEVAKDDVLKESNARVEEVGSEGKEEFRTVKVLDGEYEREVLVKRIEREEGSQVTKKAADVADSGVAIGIGSSRVTNEVIESCEKPLEDPKHIQLPVSASCAEIEKTEREDGRQGSNEAADVTDSVVAIGSRSSRVTDGVSESCEKLFEESKNVQLPVPTSTPEGQKIEREEESQGSNEAVGVANSLMAVGGESTGVTWGVGESSEKLLEDPKIVVLPVTSSSVVDKENRRHEEEIPSTVFVPEKCSELENEGTYGEVLDKKSGNEEVLQSVSVKSDFDTEKGDNNNRDQESTPENSEVLDSSIRAKDQDVESVQNMPKDSSESQAIKVMPLSPLRQAEPILDSEAEDVMIQEFGGEDITENFPTVNHHLPKRILEAERSSNNLQSSDLPGVSDHELTELDSTDPEAETNTNKFPVGDLPEVSDHELIELKTTEVSLASKPTSEYVLSSAVAVLPHPSKVLTGGEDAYFIAFQDWLGIADGVGQWSLEGTNPGVFAQELMDNCEKIVSDGNGSMLTNPREVLRLSIAKSLSYGFSTVLVAHFDGQVLHVANIGDSGFMLLRNGAVHKKSSAMFHEFSFPIQIGKGYDPSQLSQEYKVELDEGDIIVIATDGLFDNLYEPEIASIISKSLEAAKGPKEIAEVLATRAQEVGSSSSARSPFADAAQAAGYVEYTGGKLDDVAVIISLVQKAP